MHEVVRDRESRTAEPFDEVRRSRESVHVAELDIAVAGERHARRAIFAESDSSIVSIRPDAQGALVRNRVHEPHALVARDCQHALQRHARAGIEERHPVQIDKPVHVPDQTAMDAAKAADDLTARECLDGPTGIEQRTSDPELQNAVIARAQNSAALIIQSPQCEFQNLTVTICL